MNKKRGILIYPALILLFFNLCYAQEGTEPALLVTGPVFTQGIPFLGPNALPAWKGQYLFSKEKVLAYYSTAQIMIPAGWGRFSCSGREYRTAPFDGGIVYFMEGTKGWGVFLFFENPQPAVCSFLEAFFNRMNYFLGISDVFSFPAVIDIR